MKIKVSKKTWVDAGIKTGWMDKVSSIQKRICYKCNKLLGKEGDPVRIDDDKGDQVVLSHGLCPDCYKEEIAKIDEYFKNDSSNKKAMVLEYIQKNS